MRIPGKGVARFVTFLSVTAAVGCGLLAPSDAGPMGGNDPNGTIGPASTDAASSTSPPATNPPPPGANDGGPFGSPDAGGRTDSGKEDAAAPPGCNEVCAVVPTNCRSSPKCTCLFQGSSCSSQTCAQQNGDISASCGQIACTVISGKLTCVQGGTVCPCN